MDTVSAVSGRWTPERVCEAVVEAFRILPSMPVYSPRKAEFLSVLPGQDVTPLDIVALSERVLGRASDERRAMLLWARSMATGGDVGGSVRAYCRETGTNLSTFTRRRKRACARVAEELDRIGDASATAMEALRRSAPAIARRVEQL